MGSNACERTGTGAGWGRRGGGPGRRLRAGGAMRPQNLTLARGSGGEARTALRHSALSAAGAAAPNPHPHPGFPPRTEQHASMTSGAPHPVTSDFSETWDWGCSPGVGWRGDGWRAAGEAWHHPGERKTNAGGLQFVVAPVPPWRR